MLCQTCGNETPEQGLYCLNCGARVNKECPRCAEIVRFKAKVCRFCGCEFTPEEMAEIERVEQERTLEAEREKAEREKAERAERERREREELERQERERRQQEEEQAERRRREEEESRPWNNPRVIARWGNTLLQCPQCSTLNVPNLETCRRCSASLKSASRVRNPCL